MKSLYLTLLLIFFCGLIQAQDSISLYPTSNLSVDNDGHSLFGTLTLPQGKGPFPVVLIIAGSGPTDRDGNQVPSLMPYVYKQMSAYFAEAGIASLRYDKRGVGESIYPISESSLRFDHYIDDAATWIKKLKSDKQFSKVIVAGHSEGSLLGIVACQKTAVDAFISISGPGYSIDNILRTQLKAAIPDSAYYNLSCRYLDTLKQGKQLTDSDPALASLFRASIQPYMINWMQYDPATEIAKLKIPVMIVQGENDIQVSVDDAKALAKASANANLKIIPGMNHVMKYAEKDRQKNLETYGDSHLPIVADCLDQMKAFIKKR